MKNNVPASLKNVNLEAVLRRRGFYTRKQEYLELKAAARPIAQKFIKQKRQTTNIQALPSKDSIKTSEAQRHLQFTNDVVQGYWEKQIHIVETIEKQFEKRVEQYITFVERDFLAHLDSEVSSRKSFIAFVQKDYFSENEDDLLAKAQIDFTPLLDTVAVLAGQEANKLLGIDTPYIPYNIRKQVIENVDKFTKSLLDTDKQKLVDLITSGLRDGQSVPEIRNLITETFNSYSKMQAERITRTEVIRASNQASLDAYKQSGVVVGKQWLTFGAVDECAEYDGKIEKLSGNFYSSDNAFQDGDPPLHPNCKCVVLPIVENTKAYQPDNSHLIQRIAELESKIDKRTKAYKALKQQAREQQADDLAYIKSLEKHLGVADEPSTED